MHRLQNSAISLEKYGYAKLRINLKPITLALPNAISEYPEKSQYICTANRQIPNVKLVDEYFV